MSTTGETANARAGEVAPGPFRVLALDGGGIMGAFTASVLATFEAATGRKISEHFDLITGTSTGGLIALALGMGHPAAEVCQLYCEHGHKIFPSDRFPGDGLIRWFGGPKLNPKPLRAVVDGLLNKDTLDQAKVRLAIPVYDANKGQVVVFKTPHDGRYHWYKDVPAAEFAMATGAAPTYLPAHTIKKGCSEFTYIDGGVWANCPAVVGVTEAIDQFDKQPSEIHLLSVSTTNYPFRIKDSARTGGLWGWGRTLIETFMFGQVQASVALATCLLRKGKFHRVDYNAPPNVYSMDNSASVHQLIADGEDAAQQRANLDVVKEYFLNGRKVIPFQSVPAPGAPPETDAEGSA